MMNLTKLQIHYGSKEDVTHFQILDSENNIKLWGLLTYQHRE